MKRLILFTTVCLLSIASLHAQTLTLTSGNYATYLEKYTSSGVTYWRPKNTDYLKTVKKLIFDATVPNIVVRYTAADGRMRNLEELVLDNYKARSFALFGTKLSKLTIKNSPEGAGPMSLLLSNSFLSLENIDSDRKFSQLQLTRAKVTDLSPLSSLLGFVSNPALNDNDLQLNGGKYIRKDRAGIDDGSYNPTNYIREIDMTRMPETLRQFLIRFNFLEKMTPINQPFLTQTQLSYNLMWSLDLSSVTAAIGEPYDVSPQRPFADVKVEKGAAVDGSQDELRLYLPAGQSELFENNRLLADSVKMLNTPIRTQSIQGTTNKYFKLKQVAEDNVNADIDLYEKHNGFSYRYNTRPALDDSYGDKKYMRVEVKTCPYIMYINPATKSGQGVNYYSGTLWLDYDAIVPAKTTVWIVTGINKDSVLYNGTTHVSNQLVMEQIGEPGDIIPAGTAMYVRSTEQAGLYDFQKAWTHDIKGWEGPTVGSGTSGSHLTDTVWYDRVLTTEQQTEIATRRALIGNRNLLEGQGTAKTFTNKREALTLGLENQKGTGTIGLWPFNGTVVPAHRCYISEATYRRVTGDASAKGGTFFFNDAETTGITLLPGTDAAPKDDAWYSLDGRRLTGKPSQKGIYVHNGRKEVVR